MVGRQPELEQLAHWYRQALAGDRQLVLISGEVGIGKTTLVDTFIRQCPGDSSIRLGRGQCIEHYGEGEAYLPVLEALGQLGRAPGGDTVVAVLRQMAPTWLIHLPALVPEHEREAMQRQVQGTTRARMVREFAEAVEALTAKHPIVCVFEDLHWATFPVELLAYLVRRRSLHVYCCWAPIAHKNSPCNRIRFRGSCRNFGAMDCVTTCL